MKDPAFLFYYADFLVGTEFMTNEEVGAYIRCLCHQADKGGIKHDHMMKICSSYDIHNEIKKKFVFDEGTASYYNARLAAELDKRKRYSQSRANNRKNKDLNENKTNTYDKDMKNICKSYDEHMGNENININRNINIDIGGVGEKEILNMIETDLFKKISSYFKLSEIRNPNELFTLNRFLNVLYFRKQISELEKQFPAYCEYKEKSKEARQSFATFTGDLTTGQGGWNRRDWFAELQNAGQKNTNYNGINLHNYNPFENEKVS